jgi:phosphoenolpyruvate carboxykinase (GTP)
MRVLAWMLARLEGKADGVEQVFGISPRYEDLNWNASSFGAEQFDTVMSIDKADWQAELGLHGELFDMLKHHLPQELVTTREELSERVAAL